MEKQLAPLLREEKDHREAVRLIRRHGKLLGEIPSIHPQLIGAVLDEQVEELDHALEQIAYSLVRALPSREFVLHPCDSEDPVYAYADPRMTDLGRPRYMDDKFVPNIFTSYGSPARRPLPFWACAHILTQDPSLLRIIGDEGIVTGTLKQVVIDDNLYTEHLVDGPDTEHYHISTLLNTDRFGRQVLLNSEEILSEDHHVSETPLFQVPWDFDIDPSHRFFSECLTHPAKS
ncbi:MAG: hypothetical protein ACE5FT_03455 [Candidatus Nanoarchaeia archaeon]